jgi:hypothetical protein
MRKRDELTDPKSDNSPWRCPECGKLMAECWCDDHDGDPVLYDDYNEPVGSCEWCGTNLYQDDDDDLCDQCAWHAAQNKGGEDSGIQPIM